MVDFDSFVAGSLDVFVLLFVDPLGDCLVLFLSVSLDEVLVLFLVGSLGDALALFLAGFLGGVDSSTGCAFLFDALFVGLVCSALAFDAGFVLLGLGDESAEVVSGSISSGLNSCFFTFLLFRAI